MTYPNKNFMVDFKLFCCCSVFFFRRAAAEAALFLVFNTHPPTPWFSYAPARGKHFSAFSNSCVCVAPATSVSIRSDDRIHGMNMNSPFLCCSLLRRFTHPPARSFSFGLSLFSRSRVSSKTAHATLRI